MKAQATVFAQQFFHGSKVDLRPGDLIRPGFPSNFGKRRAAAFVYVTATLDAAVWGAELAAGDGPGRIYVVEAMGFLEDDPNLTDKKYLGNPTKSYRSRDPLRIVGEVIGWMGHPLDQLNAMRKRVSDAAEQGIEAIED